MTSRARTCRISAASPDQGLTRLFTTLERFAAAHHLPASVHQDLYIALDELVANVVHHGVARRGRPHICVTLTATRSRVRVVVADDAEPFNPLTRKLPRVDQALTDRPIGGLGILFVRRLMDEVKYSRRGGENRLALTKRIPAARPAVRRRAR